LISAIRIENLFGLYTYRLPQEGSMPNAAILYGDNGVGKSTILRLAFHLLSAARDRGHRSTLYNAPFEKLEVDLVSGITLRAARNEKSLPKVLELSILKETETLAKWIYFPGNKSRGALDDEFEQFFQMTLDGKARMVRRHLKAKEPSPHPTGEDAYIPVLKEHAPTMFILNADRRLTSDSVPDPSDEVQIRREMHYEDPRKINDLIGRAREIALSQALASAGSWVRTKAFQGANQGSMNVHSAYVNVLHHLMTPSQAKIDPASLIDFTSLIKQLTQIESRTDDLAQYELASKLSTAEFKKALQARSQKKKTLAAQLLKPYIRSLESRLEAVEPIYRLIDRFVRVINGFLSDKSLEFKQSQGFIVANRLGNRLTPAQLSSGEQQLLLLFSYVLTGREMPSVFIIDEPEISLNVKWQRQLIQSLLDITQGANIQFIFASHSMELLAQHRSRVVRLANTQ
jgi:energy-coupling factor transporter ATP-binding protein EcfA2